MEFEYRFLIRLSATFMVTIPAFALKKNIKAVTIYSSVSLEDARSVLAPVLVVRCFAVRGKVGSFYVTM